MKKLFAAALLFTCGLANATLVTSGDQVIDTDTGHSWFQVTETMGYTYNQMLAQFSTPGSRYFGYQYGTGDEWATLMHDGGYSLAIPFESYDGQDENSYAAEQYITNLFGLTSSPSNQDQYRTDGWVTFAGANDNIGLAYLVDVGDPYTIVDYVNDGSITRDSTDVEGMAVGSWIYMADRVIPVPVPEPASIFLVGLGLVGFAFSKKRARK
jgi:hypothetical protein